MANGRVALPKTNRAYWARKLQSNQARFRQQTRLLRRKGWHVLVVWQCQLAKSPDSIMVQVREAFNTIQLDTPR
jgi:G:T-mismatch repair DNA endonuclease (very short patch repair protein)